MSFCPKLTQINGEFPKVEYFSISHTKIDKLPSLPMVKFVNISSTKIDDIKPLYDSQKLQKLIMINNFQIKSIEMFHFVRHPDFSSILATSILDFQNCPAKHSLKNIISAGPPQNAEHVDFSETNMDDFDTFEKKHHSFETPIFSGNWYESYRLIYGPYPTPPKDSKPFLSESETESIYNIFPLPEKVDPTLASHHIMGSLFGAAIGDSLGIYCEGNDTMTINFFNDQPLDITWSHPITSKNGRYLHRGSFTDDTALMLTFLRAVVSTAIENLPKSKDELKYIFDPCEAARRIHHWIDNGIDEHLDGSGFGRGGFTTSVVRSNGYDENPIEVSRSVWEDGGKKRASNGGVMRTAGCGCFLFWDENKVIKISRRFCQCTHYDPRCVFSSVLISLIISRLIQWRVGLIKMFDLDQTIDEVKQIFTHKNDEDDEIDFIDNFDDIDPFLYADEIDELKLLEDVPRTLNTMGCAIWVLRKNFRYDEGIEKVIRAGGDTDTNAAVAGSVLGAKWGFSGIPLHILDFFWYGGILYRDATPFLGLMGMQFDPPTYNDLLKYKY